MTHQTEGEGDTGGEAGSEQIVTTTPRPFATLRVTWIQSLLGKAPGRGREKKNIMSPIYLN